MEIKLATINANNLFGRWNFQAAVQELPMADRDVTTEVLFEEDAEGNPHVRFRTFKGRLVQPKPREDLERLAARIIDVDADVLALQEVENLDALREFATTMLGNRWPHLTLIEGNDDRFIDVAVASRLPLGPVTSQRHAVHPTDPAHPVFSRDLLGVELLSPTRDAALMRLYVTHLKSNYIDWHIRGDAREEAAIRNDLRRSRQAEIMGRNVADAGSALPWVVAGDFNTDPDHASVEAFVDGPAQPLDLLGDLTESVPPPRSRNDEDVPDHIRWTHRFPQSHAPDEYRLFDQLWGSPGLEHGNAVVHRRATWTTSGTDHDPVSVTVVV